MAYVPTLAEFEQLFRVAPASLWLEDYSNLKKLFDHWRANGVTDLRAHLEAEPSRVELCAASLRVLLVNQKTLDLFAAKSQDDLLGRLPEVFKGDMFARMLGELIQLWDTGTGFHSQTVNYSLDGKRLDVLIHASVLQGHEEDWDRVLVSIEDISSLQQNTLALQHSASYARGLFEHSPVSLWVEDFSEVKYLLDEVRLQGIRDFRVFVNVHPEFVTRCMQQIKVLDVNQETLRMFGARDLEDLMGGLDRVFRDEMIGPFTEQLVDLWNGQVTQQREVINYTLQGELLNIHMQFSVLEAHRDSWRMVLVSLVDITARKKAEAYLEYLGKHDVLTRLRNRAFYTEELNRLSRRGPWPLSVVVIDLNGLKRINDEFGHAAGDAILRRMGEVLSKAVDAPACAARIGGDEFAVLLPGADERAAQAALERIQSILTLNNQFYSGQTLSMSIGVATCASADKVDAALHQADQAMYAEKTRFYSEVERYRRQHGQTT